MLYENQQIGNFNYQLGYYLGQNNFLKPFSINTYQQTYGHDKTVGDMFGNLGGKYFILEFKRSKEHYLTELNKKHRIQLLAELQASSQLGLLSRKGHFLCHSEELILCHVKLQKEYTYSEYRFSPYIELYSSVSKDVNSFTPIITGMNEFTLNIAFDEVPTGKEPIGMSYGELKEYFELLKKCVGDDDYETTGAVSCFSPESNNIVSIKFESLYELDKQLNLNMNRYNELSKTLDTNQEIPKLPSIKKDRGFTM